MSAPTSLQELFTDEMKDLVSANDQMQRVVQTFVDKASDDKLKQLLSKSVDGIAKHTGTLRTLIKSEGESGEEHCKGMEGLVAEAKKHTGEEAPEKGPLLDAVIIAQYQRMTHYGLAGFGTAAAYADALGDGDAAGQLHTIVKEIYGGDEYATKLAETSVNLGAKSA